MPWQIKDKNRDGKVVEEWNDPRSANRAMLVLSAHEIKNGREANYHIDPPIVLEHDWAKLNLPDWVIKALEGA